MVHRHGHPDRPVPARAGRPSPGHRAVPRPRLPRLVLLRRTSPASWRRATASRSTIIWNFVESAACCPAAGVLPIPSNAHWMPLAALVQVPFIWLLGPTPLASALPFWIASAAAAPLTWLDRARRLACARWQAAAAGVMVALPGAGRARSWRSRTTSACSCSWARSRCGCARAGCGATAAPSRWAAFVVGPRVPVPQRRRCCWACRSRWPSSRTCCDARARHASAGPRRSLCAGGFLLVAAPWIAAPAGGVRVASRRRRHPGASSGSAEYRDLYSISTAATPASFLAQGLGAAAGQPRAGARQRARVCSRPMPLLMFLAPFAAAGCVVAPPRRCVRDPGSSMRLCLFAASGLLFAVHVPNGTFLHSAVALVPVRLPRCPGGHRGGGRPPIARRRADWDGAAGDARLHGHGGGCRGASWRVGRDLP